jgi:hypothetical protein
MRRTLGALVALASLELGGIGVDRTPAPETRASSPHPELLVAQDVTPLAAPTWCGTDAVMVSGERTGLRVIDLSPRNVTLISRTGGPIDCTPDGKWIVYVEAKSSRSMPVDRHHSREGADARSMLAVDFWRYRREDGRRERFAAAAGGGRWSPDGTKLLFYGPAPREVVRARPPSWRLIYSRRHWPPGAGLEAAWLADSEHMLIRSGQQLYVESVNPGEPIRPLETVVRAGINLRVDRFDRAYFLSPEDPARRRQLLRCDVTGTPAVCEVLLDRAGGISSFDATRDGDRIVFAERGTECVWLWESRTREARCLVTVKETGFRLSPDGRRLAFGRERPVDRRTPALGGATLIGRVDVVVVDLPTDVR